MSREKEFILGCAAREIERLTELINLHNRERAALLQYPEPIRESELVKSRVNHLSREIETYERTLEKVRGWQSEAQLRLPD